MPPEPDCSVFSFGLGTYRGPQRLLVISSCTAYPFLRARRVDASSPPPPPPSKRDGHFCPHNLLLVPPLFPPLRLMNSGSFPPSLYDVFPFLNLASNCRVDSFPSSVVGLRSFPFDRRFCKSFFSGLMGSPGSPFLYELFIKGRISSLLPLDEAVPLFTLEWQGDFFFLALRAVLLYNFFSFPLSLRSPFLCFLCRDQMRFFFF